MRRTLIAQSEDTDHTLQLWTHTIEGRTEYELVVNGVFIMASYNALSSLLMVRRAVEQSNSSQGRLLIGGLGLGYSLREACAHERLSAIHVVELEQQVIQWNRTELYHLNGCCLHDPRVHVIHGDFLAYMYDTDQVYDLICMDIDNGPMLIVNESNRKAYATPFFERVNQALCCEGVFVIWSCNEDPRLLTDMGNVFPRCHVEAVYERHDGRDVPYYLYIAAKS